MRREPHPPTLASALLRRFCPSEAWPEVEGDFLEVFHTTLRARGLWRARARYVREVLLYVAWRFIYRGMASREPRRARSGGRAGSFFGDVEHDVRYTIRTLARTPGFTLTAIMILALGIGANTTMFTLISELFRSEPPLVERPHELVRLARDLGERLTGSLGYPDYAFYRDENEVFTGVAAYSRSPIAVALGDGGRAPQANAWTVSGNYFDVLGVTPLHGRTFLAEEDRDEPVFVALITEELWRREFGADPGLVGQTVRLNAHPFTIIGIVPRAFRGLSPVVEEPDVYVPMHTRPVLLPETAWQLERTDGMLSYWLRTVARLRPGVTLEAAQANLELLNARWPEEFAGWIEATDPQPLRVAVWSMPQFDPSHATRLQRVLRLLAAVAAVVLLIACANVAILLLARGSTRQREIAIRAAVGGSRGRVVRQLLVESGLLAAAGGIAGFGLTFWTADVAAGLFPFSFTIDFSPDLAVLGVGLAVGLAGALFFGSIPAWQVSRTDVMSLMKVDHAGRRRSLLRDVLVVGQLTLSILLVAGAVLFLRSFLTAQNQDLGYGTSGKLFLSVRLDNHGFDEARGRGFMRDVTERSRAIPGVDEVGIGSRKPLRNMAFGDFRVGDQDRVVSLGFNRVSPGYFEAMELSPVIGRTVRWADDAGSTRVMVINETAAGRLWPDGDPIGKRLTYENGVTFTVVGVVTDATYHDIGEDPSPQAYLPYLQYYGGAMTLVLKTELDPATLIPQALRAIRSVAADVAVFEVETLQSRVAEELARYRVTAVLVSIFGALALLLAAAGLYGTQSYLVTRRTREIGIRMALGAARRRVARAVVSRALLLSLIGVTLGLGAAFWLSQLVRALLFGIGPHDPWALAAAPVVLVIVAVAASAVPALRASRVDPIVALREE